MTEYSKLVKALRCKRDDCEGCDLAFFDKDEGWICQYAAKYDDAADAIEALQAAWIKSETDATNLTGRLAQAEADIERLNFEIDKRIATEIELSNQVDALQAENPIVETVLVDKMRQQMEETVCHCNVRENAELIAKILDDDVDGKAFEFPKRGKWELIDGAEPMRWGCSRCKYLSWETSSYCPRCGAKMEVQE